MLLWGVDFLMEEAKKAGIDGQLIVVGASDFGRGPFYNGDGDGAGKDHWPITSLFAMGPGIAGGRSRRRHDRGSARATRACRARSRWSTAWKAPTA